MAKISVNGRRLTAELQLARLVFWYSIMCVSIMMGVSKAEELQTIVPQSCKTQNMRFAISLSGFSWIMWPLLVWYKWLPKQIDYPVKGKCNWMKYKLRNAFQTLRGLLWALVLGADCWWISSGGVHQHIKEVLIAQIISQVTRNIIREFQKSHVITGEGRSALIGNIKTSMIILESTEVTHYWRDVLDKYGEMWPKSPEKDPFDLSKQYWRLCNESATALYNSTNLTRTIIHRDYPQLIDEEYIRHYTLWDPSLIRNSYNKATGVDLEEAFGFKSGVDLEKNASNSIIAVNQERSGSCPSTSFIKLKELHEVMLNVLNKYVRKESKAYNKLMKYYEQSYNPHRLMKDFEDVIVAQIVSQICGWYTYSYHWTDAFAKAGVQGWPIGTHDEDKEYWAISANLSHGLYNANIVDYDYIIKNCEALVDPICIEKYFPGILDTQDDDHNLDANSKKLYAAMRLIEIHLNKKVIVEDPKLMDLYAAFGQAASSTIKQAPGFKSLHTELIKEFVQIKWSTIGILLTVVYLIAGVSLVIVNNREAALQWFRSALGSSILVLLQGTAKTPNKLKRFARMLVLILLSIGFNALIGIFDPHRYWFVRWRGLIWSSLWITWLFPMLEFKIYKKYKYGTTLVAFITFFGRLIDGIVGVYFAIFLENQY